MRGNEIKVGDTLAYQGQTRTPWRAKALTPAEGGSLTVQIDSPDGSYPFGADNNGDLRVGTGEVEPWDEQVHPARQAEALQLVRRVRGVLELLEDAGADGDVAYILAGLDSPRDLTYDSSLWPRGVDKGRGPRLELSLETVAQLLRPVLIRGVDVPARGISLAHRTVLRYLPDSGDPFVVHTEITQEDGSLVYEEGLYARTLEEGLDNYRHRENRHRERAAVYAQTD